MNKHLIIILILVFIGLPCFGSNGFFTKEKIAYCKDWFLNGGIKEEFKKEILDLKTELPSLIQQVWEKMKAFPEREN